MKLPLEEVANIIKNSGIIYLLKNRCTLSDERTNFNSPQEASDLDFRLLTSELNLISFPWGKNRGKFFGSEPIEQLA